MPIQILRLHLYLRKTEQIKTSIFLILAGVLPKIYVEKVGRAGTKISDSGVSTISKLVEERKEVKGLSRLVSSNGILKKHANLCAGAYIKGFFPCMDFHGYYKKHGIETITDIWGTSHNIKDIDLLITESTFQS